uniref:Uncharacterized protein K02A2.6-like n=1 Tax=Petromyzon marinus TaxID=7757 RepID=A0AAJ7SMV2_PETMA|nr:uncharacterized protein K02A2.6-like [Petromyzon marinus]
MNQLVGIDLQEPFPRSHRGNWYILVAVEYFTRYPMAVAIPDKTALVVSQALVEHYVLKHEIPKRVIADQGSEFEAELFQALCREFRIQKDRTTAYHPQANGMVEHMNQTLAGKLKRMAAANQYDWDEHLPYALFAYATTVHTSTGQTPFLMMFGRESRLPADLLFGVPPPQQEEGSRPVEHLMETLRGARDQAYPQGEAAHRRQEQGGRPRMEPPFYSAGSKPAGAEGREEPLEWRRRPPPEPQETEPPLPRPATRAGRVPRTPRRYLVGATQARCSSQPGTGTGTSRGYVVLQQRSRSVNCDATAAKPSCRLWPRRRHLRATGPTLLFPHHPPHEHKHTPT